MARKDCGHLELVACDCLRQAQVLPRAQRLESSAAAPVALEHWHWRPLLSPQGEMALVIGTLLGFMVILVGSLLACAGAT